MRGPPPRRPDALRRRYGYGCHPTAAAAVAGRQHLDLAPIGNDRAVRHGGRLRLDTLSVGDAALGRLRHPRSSRTRATSSPFSLPHAVALCRVIPFAPGARTSCVSIARLGSAYEDGFEGCDLLLDLDVFADACHPNLDVVIELHIQARLHAVLPGDDDPQVAQRLSDGLRLRARLESGVHPPTRQRGCCAE